MNDSMFGKPRGWRSPFNGGPHARPSDPDTSHAAVPVNITEQGVRVLQAYRDGEALLDVEAYRRAGFGPTARDGQRCSDLRHAGLIERTGGRGVTPSGKRGYLCRITAAGHDYLNTMTHRGAGEDHDE
jgi:hypothetical protein